jgi:signal transduction histidine kinase
MSRLQPEIEATVCCIAAEATANAVKHGNAGHANIAVARTASALQLAITDDGTGGRPPYPGEPSRRPDSRDSWPP